MKVAAPAGVTDPQRDARRKLERGTVRIDVDDLPDLDELAERYDNRVVFSRLMTGDEPGHPGTLDLPSAGDAAAARRHPHRDRRRRDRARRVIDDLGHPSTVRLVLDRSQLDFRRIAVSNREVAGRALGELDLPDRFGATATRVRRGDVDLLATDDLVLALGDRVRVVVVAARSLAKVATYLGDSERGATDINPIGLFLGLGLGVLVGLVALPLPGGAKISLGVAGGPLLVGLVVGRLQRTGRCCGRCRTRCPRRSASSGCSASSPPRARARAPRWPTRSPATSDRACSSPAPWSRSLTAAGLLVGAAVHARLRPHARRRAWPAPRPSPRCWPTPTT